MATHRTWARARCLVTGASSGLGRALAEHLVAAGARVILTSRSRERLDATARTLIAAGADPGAVPTMAADLTRPADRRRILAFAERRFGALDLVVNSAGVGAAGHLDTHDPTVLRTVFEINVFALIEMTRAALPLLRLGDRPTLVNLGSIAARRGIPGRPEYSASKFAVAGFTESIRAEWARFGIKVLLVNPGFTRTEFEQHLIVDTARYSVTHWRTMTADQVARATLRALDRGQNELILSTPGRLLLLVNRIAPRFVDWGFRRWTLHIFPDAPVPNRHRARPRPAPPRLHLAHRTPDTNPAPSCDNAPSRSES
jgi:short-subunit dehydrogenase